MYRNRLGKHGADVDPDSALRYANSTCIRCIYHEDHLHPGKVPRQETFTANVCVLCYAKWNHPYQYQDHLKRNHPGVDPDVILGQVIFTRKSCMYCSVEWNSPYQYMVHLEKYHSDVDTDVKLRQATNTVTRNLCMYCDVEWNHPYQYKGHIREHHPNLDPDAVLGEVPGSQRRYKIIARPYKGPGVRARATPLPAYRSYRIPPPPPLP